MNAVDVIRDHLVLPTGQTYGQAAEPWQWDCFEAVFAADEDGIPAHRIVYSERRRGESKTEDSAAVALADLLVAPDGSQSFAVAMDEDQASIILDSVRGFVGRSPALADIKVGRAVVRNEITGSTLSVMASDAPSAYGLRPRRVLFDELSLQQNERLWTAMWTAIGKSPRAQMIVTSMAGSDFAGLGWRIRELARTTSAYHFHSREGSTLAPWLSEKDMEEQRATLHVSDFSRFWECRWTEARGSWISREMYDRAEDYKEQFAATGSHRHTLFVDIGLVNDATAIAVAHAEGDHAYVDRIITFQGTRADPVSLQLVEDTVADLCNQFGVREVVFEAPQAVASVQRLDARLVGVTVTARYPTADTQASLFGTLYRLFANGLLHLFPHEQLRREALNLTTKTIGGRIKVIDSGFIHQDHVVAVGGACEMALKSDGRVLVIGNLDDLALARSDFPDTDFDAAHFQLTAEELA